MLKLSKYGLVFVLGVYVGASLLAAALVRPGETTMTLDALTVELIPDKTLPLVVDSEALGPGASVEVPTADKPEVFPAAKLIVLKAPQENVCPRLHIGVGADHAIEISAEQPPADSTSTSPSPLSSAGGGQWKCTVRVAIDGQERALGAGESLRLRLAKDRHSTDRPLFQRRPVAMIQGTASEMKGAFEVAPSQGWAAHSIELASDDLQLLSIKFGELQPAQLLVVLDAGTPSSFAVNHVSRKARWFFFRWLSFIVKFKVIWGLARGGLSN